MRSRTIIYFLVFFLIIGLFIAWASYNQQRLTIDFFYGDFTSAAWVIMLITFLLGFLVCLIWMLVRNSQFKLRQWNRKKELKKKEEAEKAYKDGVDFHLKGENNKALERLGQAIQLNDQNHDAFIKAGNILREQEKYQEAIHMHWSARQIRGPDLEILASLAEDHKAFGNYGKAEETLHEAIELEKRDNISILRKLREVLLLQKKWDEVDDLQHKIIRLVQKGPEKEAEQEMLYGFKYQVGLSLIEKGEVKEAIPIFRNLTKEKPNFSPAYDTLGQIYLKEGKAEKAIDIWLDGFKASDCHFFLQNIEEYYLKQDDPQKAIDMYKKALESAKEDLYMRFLLGKLYYRLEMIDQALEEFQTIEGQVEPSPILNYFIAKSLRKRDDYEEAYESLLKILEENEECLEINYLCSYCKSGQKKWQPCCPECGHWNTLFLDFESQLTRVKVQPPSFIPSQE